MFARPTQKRTQAQKKPTAPKPTRKTIFSNPRISINNAPQSTFNKIASIRTLPPFAFINSSSGANSQRKSIECSETTSQIWREECELFQSDHKDTIKTLDKQLEDVLETVRKERNLIDMKIWKLRAKLQENSKNNKKQKSKGNPEAISVGVSTPDHEEKDLEGKEVNCMDREVQFPEQPSFSCYFKSLCNSLSLASFPQPLSEDQQQIEDQIKIKENKLALEMLFDRYNTL